MSNFVLYTYASLAELRKLQQGETFYPFIFGETKELLEENPNSTIDISALIYFLRISPDNIYSAYINLREMTTDSTIILEEHLADDALNFFPYLFSSQLPLFSQDADKTTNTASALLPYSRQPIYTYNNENELDIIIRYAHDHNIPMATFSRASGTLKSELEKFNQSLELALLDLTSVSYAIEDNKNLIYSVELFLNQFSNIRVIVRTLQLDRLLKYFPLYLEGQKPISDLLPMLEDVPTTDEQDGIKKITMLNNDEFNEFANKFCKYLIGHGNFKDNFVYGLKNFIALNKVKEQKVFSVFLFGASGIGKTEVARLICDGLLPDGYLAKINFQNYSSQDAINSLIGSPAGYIGCEHGELSDKVKKSKVGIVLCDEFEKTTRPVFSFFLELLEEGKFTDSMAREYDLDGYIIVFTSNLQNEPEYQKVIPPELKTRFDLVCEFEEPTCEEKTMFLDLLLEKAKSKFVEQFEKIEMTETDKMKLYDFNYSNIHSLRDIKRVFNQRLMDCFVSKGV